MMANMAFSRSQSQNTEAYEPSIYSDESEIPFAPDGNSALIGGLVERVKGTDGQFRNLKCVRKTIIVPTGPDGRAQALLRRELVQEAKILHLARHYHVVQFIHAYFEPGEEDKIRFAVVMDRADGNLHPFLQPGKIPIPQWFGCLINVINYIHGIGIRHRDIKPSNILIKGGRLLLADFGISQMGLGKTMPTTYQYRYAPRSREYCAPEVDRGSTRGRSADIFSLGAVFLEMLVALNSAAHWSELKNVLEQSTESTASYAKNIDNLHIWIRERFHPAGWQGEFLRTCQRMLHQDRDLRPSAADLNLAWSSLPLPDPSSACTCTGDVVPTISERMIVACKRGSAEELKSLLDQGANPATMGAMHYAAAQGSVAIVQTLLESGVPIDCLNPVGQTALHCASRNGFTDVVRQLLDSKARVNVVDENEQTALHGAAAQGHERIVEMLLKANADPSAEDLEGRTALAFAIRKHHVLVQALLESSQ